MRRQWERGKNPDVWNTPKVEKYPYEESTGQEIWGRNVPKRERMPWEAIGEMQGRNIPDKTVKPDSGRAPDVQAKPWQRNVHDSKGQMPRGSYVPRERNPWDINTRQGRNAYDESKTTAFFPSDYNLQNFPPYIKNALAYTDKTGETGAKVQPLAGGVRTPGINAHLNFVPDYAMKKMEKKAEAEKPYILPLSERANEASGEYEPADEYLSDTKSEETQEKEKVNPAPKPEEDGIIKPGYNAKGEWSEDPDADNYGKDSAKYKLLTVFDKAYAKATELDKKYVVGVVYNLRNFDDSSICEVYYMNNSRGAGTMGHTGILLVNEKGEGILFSYGAATGDVFDGPARMNIGIYRGSGLDKIIADGKKGMAVSNSGNLTEEQYNRWHGHEVSTKSGKSMFEKAVDMTVNLENYDLLYNNCDQTVVEILNAGGIKYESKILPNFTYMTE